MHAQLLYRRIVSGQAGAWATPIRGFLGLAERFYAGGVARRNRRYDAGTSVHRLPVPVISVGNLTVGGSGKTPFVISLAQRLDRSGYIPAVVSRGYGAAWGEPSDEERLIRRHCPGVVCVSDPDRVEAALVAHHRFGADVVILDDGFQHRRLARCLDIVLVDATCPFGYEHLMPRGLLREPVGGLGRADVVVLTRCEQVPADRTMQLEGILREKGGDATYLRCRVRVTRVDHLDGRPVHESLRDMRAVLFAGIGHPEAFATTMRGLGVEVVGQRWWNDHHRYRPEDIAGLLASGRFPPYDVLVTTEKDAVKLAAIGGFDDAPILVAKIAIDFVDDGDTMLQSVLDRTLSRSE